MIEPNRFATGSATLRAFAGRRDQQGWISLLFSFECLFVLYLYSNSFSFFLAYFQIRPPLDETLLFAALGTPIAAWLIWRDGLYIRALPLLGAYLLFTGWTIISMGWSPSRTLARQTITYELTFLLWALVAAAFVIAPRRERVARCLLLIGLSSTLIAAIGWMMYFSFGSFKAYMNLALSEAGLGDARAYNRVGYSVAFGSVILFTIASLAKFESLKQTIFTLLFIITSGFLLVSGSRGSFLSALSGFIFVTAVLSAPIGQDRLRLSTNQIFAVILIVAGALGMMIAVSMGMPSETLDRLSAFFFKAQNTDLLFEANRFDYFELAIAHWIENPIFGLGNSGFNLIQGRGELPGNHPHNIILEILANYGIIGFFLFLFFMWTAFRQLSLKRIMSDKLLLACLGLFFVCFVAAQGSQQLIRHDVLMASLGLLLLPAVDRQLASPRLQLTAEALSLSPQRRTAAVTAPLIRTRS